jgi:hypothetical protein
MKPFEKYLTHLTDLRKFLDTYLEMRQYFQELDFSEKDMESPPMYTEKMFLYHERLNRLHTDVLKQVNDFGFDVSEEEFDDFIVPRLKKINELIPLKDGNTEGRNIGNEDY